MSLNNVQEMYSFSQSMPDGENEASIPQLLRHVADTLEDMKGVIVHEATLHTDPNDKPHISVYYSATDNAAKQYPVEALSKSIIVESGQPDLVKLFTELQSDDRIKSSKFVYDVIFNDSVGENGNTCKLTVYMAKD